MIHLPTLSVLILSFLNLAEMMIAQAEIIVMNWMNKTPIAVSGISARAGKLPKTESQFVPEKSKLTERFSAIENNGSSEP